MSQRPAIIHFRGRRTQGISQENMKRVAEESHIIREKNRIFSKSSITWDLAPKKLLIVHKETDLEFICMKVVELINWLLGRSEHNADLSIEMIGIYPSVLKNQLSIENELIYYFDETNSVPKDIELVITLGGDGTVLQAAWIFQEHVPPIVPFHFGTLGFLTVFNWENFSNRLESILASGSRFNTRMRLNCQTTKIKTGITETFNTLNEIVVERGASPFMSILDIYGDDKFLTKIQADGVAIATPTGSTAYSLSAGGSVVHPDVNAILVTPICPHSLSFRPFIVPENLELKIIVSDSNRGNVWVSFDGRSRIELEANDVLTVRPSINPVITLCRDDQTSDWFHSLSKSLHWNKR